MGQASKLTDLPVDRYLVDVNVAEKNMKIAIDIIKN
jgi:hypothetical protein